MREWTEPDPVVVPSALRAVVGGDPLVASTLYRRGIRTTEDAIAFLDPDRYRPTSADALPDIELAVARIEQAIRRGEQVCVWGDFDVDGQTSTSLLVTTLRQLGARVNYHIPVRERESHGVNIRYLDEVIGDGAELIVTCDTGVSAHDAVKHARERGVDMVITDHHELPAALPAAIAVVNPKRLPDGHPLRDLPGAGCAYKLAEALFASARRAGDEEPLLDLVALGIVADLALQRADTRFLLQLGLRELRRTRRAGLLAMMDSARVDRTNMTEEDIGFGLGPRLNALGRLSDANRAVELLTTDASDMARILAGELEQLNARRRMMCRQVLLAAREMLDRDPSLLELPALVLSHPAWPAGVIGIVASALVEQFGRPTVMISSPPGEIARGSARSIEGCNITAAIAAQSDLLEGYGGHPMAAGLAIQPERISEFRRRLARTIARQAAPHETAAAAEGGEAFSAPALRIDAEIPLATLSPAWVDDVGRLAPFGAGNPGLTLLARDLRVRTDRKIGRWGEHRALTVEDSAGATFEVLWWDGGEEPRPEGIFDLVYSVHPSPAGRDTPFRLTWIDARSAVAAEIAVAPAVEEAVEVFDLRRELMPEVALTAIRDDSMLIWREASAPDIEGVDRTELTPARTLVIWSCPPSLLVLAGALTQVRPARVVLIARDPDLDTPAAFLTRLAGLAKFALTRRGGEAVIGKLTAAMAHDEPAVRAGLALLVARGDIALQTEDEGVLRIRQGSGVATPDLGKAESVLAAILRETAAYRRYFRSVPAKQLIRR